MQFLKMAGELASLAVMTAIRGSDGSYIAVQTEKPSYYAGETVTGWVRTTRRLRASHERGEREEIALSESRNPEIPRILFPTATLGSADPLACKRAPGVVSDYRTVRVAGGAPRLISAYAERARRVFHPQQDFPTPLPFLFCCRSSSSSSRPAPWTASS
jgi:hypothetical protein